MGLTLEAATSWSIVCCFAPAKLGDDLIVFVVVVVVVVRARFEAIYNPSFL